MNREEAIKQLGSLLVHCMSMKSDDEPIWGDDCEALKMAILALSPITREQVEKMRGDWKFVGSDRWNDTYECQQCGCLNMDDQNFCPTCGTPMKDEAVDILWKRLEAMQDEQAD